MPILNEVRGDQADQPDSGQQISASALSIGTLPVYLLTWSGVIAAASQGDAPALAWSISRTDGGSVPLPGTTSQILVTRPDGTSDLIQSSSLFMTSSVPALSITLAAVYGTLMQPGMWTFELQVELDDDVAPQIRSAIQCIGVV